MQGLAPVRVGSLSADVDITLNSTLAPAAVPAPRQNGAIGGPQAATAARPGGLAPQPACMENSGSADRGSPSGPPRGVLPTSPATPFLPTIVELGRTACSQGIEGREQIRAGVSGSEPWCRNLAVGGSGGQQRRLTSARPPGRHHV